MKIKHFRDTDTLRIEFRLDLDENTLIELGASGQVRAITMEHARERADIAQFSFEQVAA